MKQKRSRRHLYFSPGRSIALVVLLVVVIFSPGKTMAQTIDLLIKKGHVIDPKNHIDAIMDVAISEGKIHSVGKNISLKAKKVIDASGLYVCPGLIDLHAHLYKGTTLKTFANGFSSVSPDDFSFRSGITTMVDAGTSGWRNFPDFKAQVIEPSATRVLAFLNIVGVGMVGPPEEQNLEDMNPQITADMAARFDNLIVGIKIGHYTGTDWTPFERTLEASRLTEKPLLLECHLPELPLEEVLLKMRSGDIFTHAFGKVSDRMSILDDNNEIRPFVTAAREKGIRFDVGHGGGSFHYSVAMPAMKQGFYPDSFGTDLHRFSMNAGMKDMLNIMSKYLTLGMDVQDIIFRASWSPALSIKRPDLGNLDVGAEADIAVLGIREGSFGFIDSGGNKVTGKRKFEAEMTIRAGKIVWDLNGLAATEVKN